MIKGPERIVDHPDTIRLRGILSRWRVVQDKSGIRATSTTRLSDSHRPQRKLSSVGQIPSRYLFMQWGDRLRNEG